MNLLAILFAVSAESLILALGHLSTGLNYYRDGKQEQALREFSIVLSDYRDTPAADDALYWSAMAYEARGDNEKAEAALAELAKSFPQSPYLSATKASASAPTLASSSPPSSAPAPSPPAVKPPPPPVAPPVVVAVKKSQEKTVVEMSGRAYPTSVDFEKALAEMKRSRPGLVVVFRRESDVDLQMIMDVINAFDKLQVNYKLQ
jgi:tetratricopeptide (TPR) repeat protein